MNILETNNHLITSHASFTRWDVNPGISYFDNISINMEIGETISNSKLQGKIVICDPDDLGLNVGENNETGVVVIDENYVLIGVQTPTVPLYKNHIPNEKIIVCNTGLIGIFNDAWAFKTNPEVWNTLNVHFIDLGEEDERLDKQIRIKDQDVWICPYWFSR